MTTRTKVGIVGAGPAGLMLAHLLRRSGIDAVVVETRSRAYCESRVRAGVLEAGTVAVLDALGLGARLHREGLVHHGIELRFGGRSRRIDFAELTGKTIAVYGQQEVVRDLIAAYLAGGGDLRFEVADVALHGLDGDTPSIAYRDAAGAAHEVRCDVVAGCDGFHGVSRASIPPAALTIFERVYPFAWLGILAAAPPLGDELLYVNHPAGFALFSCRSPQIARYYVQCAPDDDLDAWTDARIWGALRARLDGAAPPVLTEGEVLQKGITPMRSFVAAPMRFGRLFLAGDAAHIVPPTGAKGMNLAIADVVVLARALEDFYATGRDAALDRYSATCLRRVWKTQRFSWWMTSMLHRFEGRDAFDRELQLAELDYVTGSRAGAASLAENYVGLPYEDAVEAALAV